MKFYFLQQRQSNDASPAKKTFVDSDIHNYSTRQNKAEQWIKGSNSGLKVHRKKEFLRKMFMKRVLYKKKTELRNFQLSADSRYLRSTALNLI